MHRYCSWTYRIKGETMERENLGTASHEERAHIAIAADLLEQMMRQLRRLERTYPNLRAAMATAAGELHENLLALRALTQEMAVIDDPMRAAECTSSAKSAIARLARELEHLAVHVDHAIDA
jgi:chromosome segregation ATPase